jgi:hypothetical protein
LVREGTRTLRWAAIARAVGAAVAVTGMASGGFASQAGCQLQGACDPHTNDTGFVTDTNAPTKSGMYGSSWQSGPIEGTWASFPGGQTYTIRPKRADGTAFLGPYTFQVLLSADTNPYTTDGANFAPSAGNTAEFTGLYEDGGVDGKVNTGFQVTNNTCSKYYLWLRVDEETQAGASSLGDGGVD